MKRLLLLFTILTVYAAHAQETLSPLRSNPQLYYGSPQYRQSQAGHQLKKDVIVQGGDELIETDTLSLPFLDDFSYNTLKPFHYDQYIYDVIYRAYGPCDSVKGVRTDTIRLSIVPTYSYTFNTTLHHLDSTANLGTVYHYYPQVGTDCFDHLADSIILYPLWYHYSFDSITGQAYRPVVDTLNDTLITYSAALYRSVMPAYVKWLDNYANHNYTLPYLPPSLGVATLDGMNEVGRPYDPIHPLTLGIADYLTSKPINMNGLGDGDSVYLSFFYEPRGYGDWPNLNDSLRLEFYNGYTSQWDEVWATPGFQIAPPYPDTFHQVMIRVPSTITPTRQYFFNGFQFRFSNYATLSGNNDHWHIDYVRLDRTRSVTDTAITDIAFQYHIPSVLKIYSEMPAWQFVDSIDLADSIALYVTNLDPDQAQNNPPATSYSLVATELYPTPQQAYFATSSFNAGTESVLLLRPSSDYNLSSGPFDSLVIQSKATINVPNILLTNDTAKGTQTLTNILAYDDGSAERAYGVRNLGLKKFAYEYKLHQPDTVVGYQVLFTNIDANVSDLVFVYNLWDSITLNNPFIDDTARYTSNNQLPLYVDSVSGFATYRIDPVPVSKHFYFGWSQTDTRDIQIGYDLNSTKGYPYMYSYNSGVWNHTGVQVPGSVMIRLLMRHSSQIATGITDALAVDAVKAYPNPTTGVVNFDLPDGQGSYMVELYSATGQLAYKNALDHSASIDISSLTVGIYMLRLTDMHTGVRYQNKIVRTSN